MTAPLLDLIVPLLGRPHRALPFMRSLIESTPGDIRVIVVVSPWDYATGQAWRELEAAGVATLRPQVLLYPGLPGSFAQKCNHAYRQTADLPEQWGRPAAPWVMLCGDDVKFHPGWVTAALAYGQDPAVGVIGTNTGGPISDGGTPHPIIRRAYVDTVGASWDGPGSLCHGGYRHNFVDVEIATVAQDRGAWIYGHDVMVEHECYYQGKAPFDGTYGISSDTVEADRALWQFRSKHFATG